MLQKMPEMAESIYKDFPELKPLKVAESWIDLDKINGYYINEDSAMSEYSRNTPLNLYHQNVFKSNRISKRIL
jgi:hypothetical protein